MHIGKARLKADTHETHGTNIQKAKKKNWNQIGIHFSRLKMSGENHYQGTDFTPEFKDNNQVRKSF